MKILILKPSSLGDVVHALPVLRLLKLHRPDSEVFWWLESNLISLLDDDPDLAGIFPFQRKRWRSLARFPEIVASLRSMRRERFDVAIDLQGLARSGAFTWFSKAELKIGFSASPGGAREVAHGYYDLSPPAMPSGTHAVDRYLSVLPLLGVPIDKPFRWLPDQPAVAAELRGKWRTDGARWITLLPGARWESKRWPVENFAELAKTLGASAADVRFAILGGNEDRELGAAIAAADPNRCLDLTGRTSLPEMVEWIRLSDLVVTNDTGPMHVAAALGKPVTALFGPTDPDCTGPYRQRHNVIQMADPPCIPCFKNQCTYKQPLACLRSITPAAVVAKARQQMA